MKTAKTVDINEPQTVQYTYANPAINKQGNRTIKQMIEEYHYAGGEGGLRRLIEDNKYGISICVYRVGKRIMINLEKYYKWLDSINEVA